MSFTNKLGATSNALPAVMRKCAGYLRCIPPTERQGLVLVALQACTTLGACGYRHIWAPLQSVRGPETIG